MHFTSITIFPELVEAVYSAGVVGRASRRELISHSSINPRDFATDTHRTVDDRPYGGGPGMVMKPEPLAAAIACAKAATPQAKVVYLSPQGRPLTQAWLQQTANNQQDLVLLAGRYEGVDERLIDHCIDEEISLGDFVLSGGELAAMVLIDGIVRLLPDVLGHQDSADQDSFSPTGLLDCPHYTRPEVFANQRIPEVLKSGDHAAIARWRRSQAIERTRLRRPELLAKADLSVKERQELKEQKLVPGCDFGSGANLNTEQS